MTKAERIARYGRGPEAFKQMQRARAARGMIETRLGSPALAARAFMAIFHPEAPEEIVRAVVEEAKNG